MKYLTPEREGGPWTLNGSACVMTIGVADTYRMPTYTDQLSDQQISEVLSFVGSALGRHGGNVMAGGVKALREHANPVSSKPIVQPTASVEWAARPEIIHEPCYQAHEDWKGFPPVAAIVEPEHSSTTG